MPIQPDHRQRGDRCPGLLRPFIAEDGAIVRLRLPGGDAPVGLLAALMQIASAGAGFVQLTSRGNLQLRGLPDPLPNEVVHAIMATGLMPSATHERVRNFLASPLSGWWPSNRPGAPQAVADVRGIVAETDRLLCAERSLAQLPGRFLFAVDDGRGDVLAEPYDVAYRATERDRGEVRVGRRAFAVAHGEAAQALVAVARAFQDLRESMTPPPWHIRELDAELPGFDWADSPAAAAQPGVPPEPGPIGPHAVVGLPLARITPAILAGLAAVTDRVIITPWRSVVVPDGASHLEDLAAAGLATQPHTGWARVSACTGAPGCFRAERSTEALATKLVGAVEAGRVELSEPIHLVACARNCGTTASTRAVAAGELSAALADALDTLTGGRVDLVARLS